MRALRGLKKYDISATVVDMHTIKPLDTTTLDQLFATHKLIVTLEEHTVVGGLGSAVAEYKATKINVPPQMILGIQDSFPKAASTAFILNQNGLSAPRIAERIVQKYQELF